MSAGAVVLLHRVFLLFILQESGRPKGQPQPVRPTTWTQSMAGCSCASSESKKSANASKVNIRSVCPELPKAYYQLFQNEKLKLLKEKWLEKANAYKTKIHRISSVHNILHCSDRSKYFRAHITYHLPHHCTHQQGIPSSRTHTTSYFKREPLLGQISFCLLYTSPSPRD